MYSIRLISCYMTYAIDIRYSVEHFFPSFFIFEEKVI